MSCDSDIIHQDENICILHPRLGRGVELIHTVGYMEHIGPYRSLFNSIERDGLKSAEQLFHESSGGAPLTEEAVGSLGRSQYLAYNRNSLKRIFFRPPMSAPYRLEGDTIVSAGNWSDFLGG